MLLCNHKISTWMYEAEGQGHKYNLSINRMEDLMVVKTTKRHCYQT